MQRFLRTFLLILIIGIPLDGYVPKRISVPGGLLAYAKWADSSLPIVWRPNPAQGSNITGSRSVLDVGRLSFQAWSSVATARISFQEGAASTLRDAAVDQVNLVSFSPTSFSSGALALTVVSIFDQAGVDAFGGKVEFPGQIVEADILINPAAQFSTDLNPPGDMIDLQRVVTHEIGHLLGLDHSALLSAVMFPTATNGDAHGRTLSTDDGIGISMIYPTYAFSLLRGSLSGVVKTSSASPVFGAHVVIADASGKAVASTLTDPDGAYQVQGLEPGSYLAYAEPLDAPMTPSSVPSLTAAYPSSAISTQFTTRFGGTSASSTTLRLAKTGGDSQTGDIGEALALPLEVEIRDNANSVVAGAGVTFTASSGGATVVPVFARTDTQGKARTTAYLGAGPAQSVAVSAGSAGVTFAATLRPPTITSLTGGSGVPGTAVSVTLAGTNFVRGATTVAISGTGITAGSVNTISPTRLTTTFTIDAGAPLGMREVRVLSVSGASGAAAFVVASVAGISFLDASSNAVIKELTVNEGNAIQARPRIIDGTGAVRTDISVAYSSSNPDVATVDSSGNIQGKKAGFSTLAISGGGAVATATITVVQINTGAAGLETTGVVQDLANRLYLAASQDHTIRLVQSLGQTPQVYAGIPQTPGLTTNQVRLQSLFRAPAFLAVNQADGTLYVSDGANNVIRRVFPGTDGRVDVFAGTGAAGSLDGAAASATFNNPQGIALDSAGYLWVVDSGNNTIRRIDLINRTVETIAGQPGSAGFIDGAGTQARFKSPAGLAVETERLSQQLDRSFRVGPPPPVRVVVADTGNGAIRRISEGGQVETLQSAGSAILTDSKDSGSVLTAAAPLTFASPTGVAVDPFGNIFVTEPALGQVKTILQSGDVVSAAQANTFRNPKGIVIGLSNRVVVADSEQSAREIRYGGPEIISVTPNRVGSRGGAAITIQGHNFASDTLVIAGGVVVSNVTIADTESLSFIAPALESGRTTISVQNRGGLAQTSLIVDPVPLSQLLAGNITTIAGGATFIGDGGAALSAIMYDPGPIAIDSSGNLFVVDYLNYRVRKVDLRTGMIRTVAGTGISARGADGNPAAATPLYNPHSVVVDAAGNLYISEPDRIRKVDIRTGIISTVPGAGAGTLNNAKGLVLDKSGTLYVADSSNHRVIKVDPQTGTVSPVAGTGQGGTTGDNGPATAATLLFPSALAFDSAQNLYIADAGIFASVRRVDAATGTITTFAGGGATVGDSGPATSAALIIPGSLAVDSDGNLYIGDYARIRKVDRSGTITTAVGNGQGGSSGDGGPVTSATVGHVDGLAVDSAGNLYISDYDSNRIRKVDPQTGIITTLAGTGERTLNGDNGPVTAAALTRPYNVSFDPAENMYIADTFDRGIRKVNAQTGIITTVAGTGDNGFNGDNLSATAASLYFPSSMVADADGNLYIADTYNYRVRKVDSQTGIITTVAGTGENGSSGDNGAATAARLGAPSEVVRDSAGNLYIACFECDRIRKLNLQTGIITTVAGGQFGFSGDNGPATAAALNGPSSISFDSSGNLYIADTGNYRIRKVDAQTGTITTVAGNGQAGFAGDGGAATAARLSWLYGVAVDSSGNLFIADTDNNRIRKVNSSGIITSVAGAGQPAPIGDDGPAAAASLVGPRGVKIDASGNLIIADTFNHRIRAVKAPIP